MLLPGSGRGKGSKGPARPSNPWSGVGSLPTMPSRLQWTNEKEFTVDGVAYASMPRGDGSDRLAILKPRSAIETYETLVESTSPKTIVELGIFGGGSTALLAQLAVPAKLVAVEIHVHRIAALDSFIERLGLGTTVSAFYGVDQADAARLAEIVEQEFNGTPIDLVIDDASHLVDQTRASFDALFPHVRPGGSYVIEDWSWPHRLIAHPNPDYRAVTPVSAFALELGLAAACDDSVIADVTLQRGLAIVRRGPAALDPGTFHVASHLDAVARDMAAALASTRTLG
jgi:predicted O-methyltransferase YrrM